MLHDELRPSGNRPKKPWRSRGTEPQLWERFQGVQANTSPLPYAQLDGAADLHCTDPCALALEMEALGREMNLKIWGGCCGDRRPPYGGNGEKNEELTHGGRIKRGVPLPEKGYPISKTWEA